ncbi:proprotein convertase P-domain-containing protein [Streptomyces sp. ZAF1911]|nr:proprotein convertase P-domain-containing protein [Streptomyces sp. ZAF1911]MDD9380044.1 proprotein convertase P-domain-containing protein [Streptomyces sp. ZAF1911]
MVSQVTALRSLAAGCASVALLIGAGSAVSADPTPNNEGQVVGAHRPGVIAGSYIVTLKDAVQLRDVPGAAQRLTHQHGGAPHLHGRLSGFSAKMSEAQARKPGITGTFTVNASSEAANGTWKLRVSDNAAQDTGYINSWSLQF